MTLRLRVHVDEDGNAVVPLGKELHGLDVDLRVELVQPASPRAVESLPVRSHEDADVTQFVTSVRAARPPQPTPRTFTPAETAERLAEFDALTGAWQGPFVEPADPPEEPARTAE